MILGKKFTVDVDDQFTVSLDNSYPAAGFRKKGEKYKEKEKSNPFHEVIANAGVAGAFGQLKLVWENKDIWLCVRSQLNPAFAF